MGKQSARLYYRGKDHKDIYFQGKYHNAMIVCKEGDPELVWRKLKDSEYFFYIIRTNSSLATSYGTWYPSIVYPEYKARDTVDGFDFKQWFISSNGKEAYAFKCLSGVVGTAQYLYTKDGKVWKKYITRNKIYTMQALDDGFIGAYLEGNTTWRYFYVKTDKEGAPISEEDIFESPNVGGWIPYCVPVSKNSKGGGTAVASESPDGMLIYHAPNRGAYDSLHFRILKRDGGFSEELETSKQITSYQQKACYGDGTWVIPADYSYEDAKGQTIYNVGFIIHKNGKWKVVNSGIKNLRGTSSVARTIVQYDGEKFILYIYSYNFNNDWGYYVRTTKDFESYNEITIPSKLIIPYIGGSADGYEYIDILLDSSAEKETGHLGSTPNRMDIDQNICCKNGKITIPDKLVFMYNNSGTWNSVTSCVCIDNLYFKDSDGNFAIYQQNKVGDINLIP